jgi:alkylation response protein AidB-like acyl-CoA dehydrogenase
MDFAFTQEQEDIRKLAGQILGDFAATDKLPDFQVAVEWYDDKAWKALAEAGMLGIALPSEYGGMGMGFEEVAVLAEQAGMHVAPLPIVPAMVAASAIVQFGSDEQKTAYLAGFAEGNTMLTTALDDGDSYDSASPSVSATPDDNGGWLLTGLNICVPLVLRSERVMLAATRSDGGGTIVVLLDPRDSGVVAEPQEVTTGELRYALKLTKARVPAGDVLASNGNGAEAWKWVVEHATALLCAMELGVAEKAIRLTAKYSGEREQFGKAIATFQAVAQRAADAYIDIEAIRLATWQAVWRLAQGLESSREVAIAKFWASEGGHNACYAAQHLHGGIGVDTDYPLHRYYLLSRQIELTLGGAKTQLAKIGDILAERGPKV